ncbi:fluoride efflux transporter FluC [Halobaculum sp. D14]|uniref:fluoride efflux transporter FluC n=1 Tax=unclassified Halobaculum TaxID=2640896 RepID=UPI003EBC7733
MDDRVTGIGLVAAGGAVGAALRYGVGLAVAGPAGTLLVNVAGSLLLGVLVSRTLPKRVQLFAATGLCSSFTTYSTFAVDAVSFGSAPEAAAYVAATYVFGVAAATAGLAVGGGR